MQKFVEIAPREIATNSFDDIGRKWMIITCEDTEKNKTNVMTASWGMVGEIWGKAVCTLFIRPQRYSHDLALKDEKISVNIFGEEYRQKLAYCGRVSGRDADKVAECGFTPFKVNGGIGFEEADMVLVLKKLYVDKIKKESFEDADTVSKWYPDEDFHTVLVCEIENVLVNNGWDK